MMNFSKGKRMNANKHTKTKRKGTLGSRKAQRWPIMPTRKQDKEIKKMCEKFVCLAWLENESKKKDDANCSNSNWVGVRWSGIWLMLGISCECVGEWVSELVVCVKADRYTWRDEHMNKIESGLSEGLKTKATDVRMNVECRTYTCIYYVILYSNMSNSKNKSFIFI